jgi:hypothetical protein
MAAAKIVFVAAFVSLLCCPWGMRAEDYSFAAVVNSAASVANGEEVRPGTLIHARDEEGRPITLRIDSVEADPTDPEGEISLYEVSYQRKDTGEWVNYCLPDAQNVQRAIPISGSWDETVQFHERPGVITFACTGGAMGKCIRFGYKPWKMMNGVSVQPYHQACVRMIRADYCGNGRSYTITGTYVDMYDRLNIQRPEADAEHTEILEAAWGPDGATYIHVLRLGGPVEDVVRDCPDRLAGRTSQGQPLSPEEIYTHWPETLLINNRARIPGTRPR